MTQQDDSFGQPIKVAEGLYQLKMPLPFRLDHINLYLLDHGDCWTLVDTGLNDEKVKAVWEKLFDGFFRAKPIVRVVLTHLHPDHLGLACWIQKTLDVPIFISKKDWDLANTLWDNDSPQAKERLHLLYQSFGVQGEQLEHLLNNRSGYKKLVKELPERVTILKSGSNLYAGKHCWKALAAPGHTPEHLCLWNDKSQLLISGDHILPKITPNISVLAYGLKNPLESYLHSLESLRELPCVQYFPAHGKISSNFQERITQLIDHHKEKLNLLLEHCGESLCVNKAMPILFGRELPVQQHMFALGETAAHLVYLAERGLVEKETKLSWQFKKTLEYAEVS